MRNTSVPIARQGCATRSLRNAERIVSGRASLLLVAAVMALLMTPARAPAQFGFPPPQPPVNPRAIAPLDFAGYWVSIVTEDWRFRMITPAKGDYASVPLNSEGKRVADTWDSAKDEVGGNQCKSYGAAAIMRVPTRLYISWVDDNTLRVDTDAGTQTRTFHFSSSRPAAAATLQGDSVAEWEGLRKGGFLNLSGFGSAPGAPRPVPEGYLKVITTQMLPGYLRKNGVPYSANAKMEEDFDSFKTPNGDTWLVVTTIVTDPQYLTGPFITSTHFKKLPDASGWSPTPCEAE